MSSVKLSGTATLGDRQVYRLGYGAMQLAGPGVFGPPKDPQTAIRVLQEAVESGVNHIDTSDFDGPHVTNQLIRQALHPYTAALVSAIPEIDPDKPLPKNLLGGEPPSPVAVPQGCAFHPRCPYAQVQCRTGAPPPTRQIADRAYACVLNLAGDETVFPLTGGSFDEAQAD